MISFVPWHQLPPRPARLHGEPRTHVEAMQFLVDRPCCESRWYRGNVIRFLDMSRLDFDVVPLVHRVVLEFRALSLPMFVRPFVRNIEVGHIQRELHELESAVVAAIVLDCARRVEVPALWAGAEAPSWFRVPMGTP